jgi:hypothetical protein
VERNRHLIFEGLGGQGVVLGWEYGVTEEAVQCFKEVADRNGMFHGRDGQPPWELVDDERHGVHARLRCWLLEYPGGKTHRGCMHVGGERMGGKRGIVDDGWDVGVECEERMDGDGPVRERERGIVVLGRGARARRVARGRKGRLRERRRRRRLGRVKNVLVVETDLLSGARHLARCATTQKGSLDESLEAEKERSRV